MAKTRFAVIFMLTLFRCGSDKENLNARVIESTIADLLEVMAESDSLSGIFLVHEEQPKDKIKTLFLKGSIKQNLISATNEVKLVESLLSDSAKEVGFKFSKRLSFGKNNYVTEFDGNHDVFSDSSFFGSINLSDAAIDDSLTLACYYFAVNCGKSCSQGFLVFAGRSNDKWQIEKVIPLWQG